MDKERCLRLGTVAPGLVSGHWSAWQAARVEVNQAAEIAERAEQDIASDVVEQVIQKTNIKPAT